MQLVNSIAQDALDFRGFRGNTAQMPRENQPPPRNFAPRQVTLSNAPHWMNNVPVPMDTSNRACAPNWHNRPSQGNIIQVEPNPLMNRPPRKCYNCDKVGHLAAQCCALKKARINFIINEPEEMTNLQVAITPDGILNNALTAFD